MKRKIDLVEEEHESEHEESESSGDESEDCAVLGTCKVSSDPCRVVLLVRTMCLLTSLCSVRVFKLFSRSIHYIFGDEERVRTPTAR